MVKSALMALALAAGLVTSAYANNEEEKAPQVKVPNVLVVKVATARGPARTNTFPVQKVTLVPLNAALRYDANGRLDTTSLLRQALRTKGEGELEVQSVNLENLPAEARKEINSAQGETCKLNCGGSWYNWSPWGFGGFYGFGYNPYYYVPSYTYYPVSYYPSWGYSGNGYTYPYYYVSYIPSDSYVWYFYITY